MIDRELLTRVRDEIDAGPLRKDSADYTAEMAGLSLNAEEIAEFVGELARDRRRRFVGEEGPHEAFEEMTALALMEGIVIGVLAERKDVVE